MGFKIVLIFLAIIYSIDGFAINKTGKFMGNPIAIFLPGIVQFSFGSTESETKRPDNPQTNCGHCFPGTSASLCPYRKPTDSIICGSDGHKYNECTFQCVLRGCNPIIHIVGCGADCTPSGGHSCPDIEPQTPSPCFPANDAPCSVQIAPPVPADTACAWPATTHMVHQCNECSADSIVKGSCTVSCRSSADSFCQVLIHPKDGCDLEPPTEACLKCAPGSLSGGQCAGPSTETSPKPEVCLPITDDLCRTPIAPPTLGAGACGKPANSLMILQCSECTPDSVAKGSCSGANGPCWPNTDPLCQIISQPKDSCDLEPPTEACYKCFPGSPSGGNCGTGISLPVF